MVFIGNYHPQGSRNQLNDGVEGGSVVCRATGSLKTVPMDISSRGQGDIVKNLPQFLLFTEGITNLKKPSTKILGQPIAIS